ncbi:unnamed protein product, partial [Scytosiphon promiscuus]
MQMRRWVIGLQALVRGWLGRREAQSQKAHAQRLGEERMAGLVRSAYAIEGGGGGRVILESDVRAYPLPTRWR